MIGLILIISNSFLRFCKRFRSGMITPFSDVVCLDFNAASYLKICFDSILSQSFKNWEAIYVDYDFIKGNGAILDTYV